MKKQSGHFRIWKDSIGKNILNVKVLSFSHRDKNKNIYLKCQCICGKEFTRSFSALNKKLTKNSCGCLNNEIYSDAGKRNKKYFINHDKLIDNSKISYISGLLGSDGHYCKNRERLELCLQYKDLQILKNIANYLEFTGQIYKNIEKNRAKLSIEDKFLCKFFETRGVVRNKSYIYSPPEIYNNCPHYWRGMIDGDGCIHINKNNRILLSLCGTTSTVEKFKSFCNTIVNTKNKIYKYPNKNLYGFNISGKKAHMILQKIYENKEEMYIDRKFKKFNSFRRYLN